ncbi:hypothetical protein FRC03_000182 [Tulasnella sp. 419]|nr:hypothetical protein FRC03_000182 [Tulasnella sp. 419]
MQPQEYPEHDAQSSIFLLPPELVLLILQFTWNRSDRGLISLCSCSLVCRMWRPISQGILFTKVVLRREVMAQSFLSATQANPSLGSSVKSLKIMAHSDVSSNAERDRVLPQTAHAVTSHCPNLYHLNVVVWCHFDSVLLPFMLHQRAFETLRALDLCIEETECQIDSCWIDIFYFIHRFHALSHLRLKGILSLLKRGKPSSPMPPPPSFHLVEFIWLNNSDMELTYTSTKFELVTEWLFGKSSESLRILDFSDWARGWFHFAPFISNHGKNLVSLRLDLAPKGMSTSLNLLQACPGLREVILRFAGSEELSWVLGSALPITTLEQISLVDFPGGEKAIAEIINSAQSLPRLRCISLSYTRPRDPLWDTQWAELSLGKFNLEREYSDFRNEDLILPANLQLPRGRTIENLRHMVIT